MSSVNKDKTGFKVIKKGKVQLTKKQRQQIKEAFDLFDLDARGIIDPMDLRYAMGVLGFECTSSEDKKLRSEMDRQGKGQIEFGEFQKQMSRRMSERDPQEQIRRKFKLLCSQRTGKIGLQKFEEMARELGETMTKDQLKEMLVMAGGSEKDYQISEQQFLSVMENATVFKSQQQ